MFQLDNFGGLVLSSRLKRLSDVLFKQTEILFKQRQINISSRSLPLMQLLAANGATAVTEMAEHLSQTHPAISQMSKKLEANGWLYFEVDATDERKRLLILTPAGYELVDKVSPLVQLVDQAIQEILKVSSYGLIANIDLLERELAKQSLSERVNHIEMSNRMNKVEIIHFKSEYGKDFFKLNQAWLEKYFYMEMIDHEILSNPQTKIIDKGGFVLLARLDNNIIGTAALIANTNNQLELSKMAVDPKFQNLGVGKKLAKAAIEQYRATDFECLFLESNRKLLPALNLYQSLGFVEQEPPFKQSHYSRADIYMVFKE